MPFLVLVDLGHYRNLKTNKKKKTINFFSTHDKKKKLVRKHVPTFLFNLEFWLYERGSYCEIAIERIKTNEYDVDIHQSLKTFRRTIEKKSFNQYNIIWIKN